ncbi:MAG: hypothetical protein DRG82_16225 [Deltaproteobacteria bacterium]|nr:MAG: hypothetical protein DRG82_16225 [Deltaproteobacteria bacterium]
MNVYAKDRVFAKILLLQVRSFSDYSTSEPYMLVKRFSQLLLDIIKEGVEAGEIRDDIDPRTIRQVIIGSIEHVCLTSVMFGRDIHPDDLTESLCELVFKGIEKRPGNR